VTDSAPTDLTPADLTPADLAPTDLAPTDLALLGRLDPLDVAAGSVAEPA
jgi:hypothetical protein